MNRPDNNQNTEVEVSAVVDEVVYMFYDSYGNSEGGPYVGKSGLDFQALVDQYRAEQYKKSEDAESDLCVLFGYEFVDWMVACGILRAVVTVSVTIDLDQNGTNRYTPKHWPACPECGQGRGEETMGRVLHALNRAEWYRKCAECGHEWDHQDHPYHYDQPMLEDDGRCIEGGCVPYSISQAGSLSISEVVPVCRRHGWSESRGMHDHLGIQAAVDLGLRMTPRHIAGISGKPTLRKFLATLHHEKNYIVATKGHWLAVVNGENRDQAETSMRSEVLACWEVLPATEAVPELSS